MSDSPEQRAMATVKQAQQLIDEINRSIDNSVEQLRKHGVDPDKVRAYANKSISADSQSKADDAIRKDLEEIEDEVNQAKMRGTPGDTSSKAKRPRSMV